MAAPHLVRSSTPLTANEMLDVVEEALHSKTSEWLFFRELRVGTGRGKATLQRLDAFAFNSLPHHAMKRICYEVKCSRGDLLGELKRPLKRRVGMRYSNEFYFVVPGGMVDLHEIPSECGLLEVGMATAAEWQLLLQRQAGFFRYTPESQRY
ncbi:MAG TPA: hypothetical protein VE621_17695, partial [Bryobacteraceae bacterium]|nr:hypothetical protein [Bryobacteraceae bacterium]